MYVHGHSLRLAILDVDVVRVKYNHARSADVGL